MSEEATELLENENVTSRIDSSVFDERTSFVHKLNRIDFNFEDLREEQLSEDNSTVNAVDGRIYNFDHTVSTVEGININDLAMMKIEDVLQREELEATTRRSSMCEAISRDMLEIQESQIRHAFHDVNFLRAHMASLCQDHTKLTIQKHYLVRFAHASVKESYARKKYRAIVLAAALKDSKTMNTLENSNLQQDWINRINNDITVRDNLHTIYHDKESNPNLQVKKKHEFEYHRAKAILKADFYAFKTAWPNSGYTIESAQIAIMAARMTSSSSAAFDRRNTSISEISVHVTTTDISADSTVYTLGSL